MTSATSLTILQINEVHGYLEPHPELTWGASGAEFVDLGGYPRIASLFRQVREERPGAVLAFDNGDTFHGTFAVVHSKGEALVPVLNALELDAMTAHWDFRLGTGAFPLFVG